MGKVIAVANQKGGSGKTTTVQSLGAAFAERGRRVLMVDMDPQASLSEGCGISLYELERTIYHVLLGSAKLPEIVLAVDERLDLAPANIHLSAAEIQLVSVSRREDRLRNAIRTVRDGYEYVLIDCPPSFGLLTLNCLSAADSVLIPMTCDYYTMLGVRLLLDTVREIQAEVQPELRIEGLVATRFDGRTLHAREILEQTRSALGSELRVFDTVIRESVRFKEAPINGQTILKYAGTGDGAMAYRALAEEIEGDKARTRSRRKDAVLSQSGRSR
ncbi:MAG: AAA family ATPase [Chloroflexi bacterium]|nr:AAA family ATPase [Chloroflexota bacterium]